MASIDNYLPCSNYLKGEKNPKFPQFSTFQDSKTKGFYFAFLNSSDEVLFRSEGYEKASSCENGIKSVIKNYEDLSRFSIVKEKSKYFVVLKAGNNKEIARSCDFKTEELAQQMINGLFSPSEDNELSVLNADLKSFEIVSEEYLPLESYFEKERIHDNYGITGYAKFQDLNGMYYFVVYNPDGSLYLISKGYKSEDERDNSFDVTESVIVLEENYKIEHKENGFYAVLFESDEILAISPTYGSFIEAYTNTPGGRPKQIIGSIF